ncbi:MAG: hypothetical protein RQ760_14660 [Sedimentisphaerales bacterium]|nr:hypothetical protein [Sedimentisphaerales bacterium]
MNKVTKSLVVMTLLVAMGTTAIGQESLKDIIEQEGFAWMVGQWKAVTDDGSEIILTYRWAVEGHAIVSDLRMGESLSQGIIYLVKDEQQARQLTVDSRGQAIWATWEVQDGKVISKTKMINEYGEATDVGFAFSKIDATTMNVAAYELENGELSDYSSFDIDFKKQKKMETVRTMGSASTGPESLKDIVEQQGIAWMVGRWKATTDDGTEILLSYLWAVKGHAMISSLKMGERESLGIIYLDMDAEQGKQISVDSRGEVTKATWEAEYGEAISKTKMTNEYGEATDVGIAYSKVDNNTINVALYGLDNGELSDDSWFDINFKKEKK